VSYLPVTRRTLLPYGQGRRRFGPQVQAGGLVVAAEAVAVSPSAQVFVALGRLSR
jgi:hypothetical protein